MQELNNDFFNKFGAARTNKSETLVETPNKYDIKISLLEHNDEIDKLETSKCILEFSGKNINYVIMSTIRRVIMSLLPVYAFDISNIKITKNTSVFCNDYLALRFSNFPVYIKKELTKKYIDFKKLNDVHILNSNDTIEQFQYLEYLANLGSAEIDTTIDIKQENIKDNLTIVINVENKTDIIMDVMTNTPGVKFYYKSEQISNIFNTPLLIVQLQPGQEIICSMISSLNIAMSNGIYSPCTLCHCTENDNKFKFILMSRRQISEYDMLIRACEIIKKKTLHAKTILIENINKYKSNDEDNSTNVSAASRANHYHSGNITIEGEQHTMGNLISRFLQDYPNILIAGYKVHHPNVNKCDISYESKINIIDVINDITENIINIYDTIQKQIESIGKFGYNYI